jgi:hypothetical protein
VINSTNAFDGDFISLQCNTIIVIPQHKVAGDQLLLNVSRFNKAARLPNVDS